MPALANTATIWPKDPSASATCSASNFMIAARISTRSAKWRSWTFSRSRWSIALSKRRCADAIQARASAAYRWTSDLAQAVGAGYSAASCSRRLRCSIPSSIRPSLRHRRVRSNTAAAVRRPHPRELPKFSALSNNVCQLEVHPMNGNFCHDEVSTQHTVQHCTGIDERHAVDQQGFGFVELTLLVANASDKACG